MKNLFNFNKSEVREPKFNILLEGDVMKTGDEYYNNYEDKWLPIEEEYTNVEFDPDISKMVRRKTPNH